jgi:serine/threonine protein kinase/tetratricopeptide (TPR) repeat protein
MLGQVLGHYCVLEQIGAGGMGIVFRAHDQRLDRDVAIKVLPPGTLTDENARKRFRREALALSRLNHPNIETVHDFDTQNGVDFLVLELIPGITLDERLAAGALEEREIMRLGAQLAEGLAAAHQEGVVHRDLKPSNLRITSDGRLKILDFGLARLFGPVADTAVTESLSQTRGPVGTPSYMAPEQLRASRTDARCDIWATGTVLYEMATGRRPFPSRGPKLAEEILHEQPAAPSRVNPKVSLGLEAIIFKCLEKEPENRYSSAREIVVDLHRLTTASTLAPVRGRREPIRRILPWAVAPLVVLVAVLIGLNVRGIRDRTLSQPGPRQVRSVAVLPLENLSGDPEQGYFADGMTEELILNLSKMSALKVISRTSVMQYKGVKRSLPEIARELDVDTVVEGSVAKGQGRVRIMARLIEAPTDRLLWAQSYEGDLKDVLALQASVAQAIAAEIQVKLNPQEQARLAAPRTVKPEAYEAYLRGRYYWNRRNRDAVLRSLEYFQEATRIDPTYALAYSGVADSYIVIGGNHWLPPGQAFPRARAAALEALRIDGTLPEAHTSLAWVAGANRDWPTAEKEYKRALELNPSYALARQWYSYFLSHMGRHEEAVVQARRAVELDPRSVTANMNVGQVLYIARRYEEAEKELSKILAMDPSFGDTHYSLGVTHAQQGRFQEAIEELRRAVALSPGDDLLRAALGYAYARSGRKAEGQEVLHEFTRLSRQRYVSGYDIALVYVGLGEKGEAIRLLEKAYKQGDPGVVWVGTEPMFDSLRADPRMQKLLERLRLPRAPVKVASGSPSSSEMGVEPPGQIPER